MTSERVAFVFGRHGGGHRLALALAVLAAVLPALFGALQKGRDDP